MLKQLNDIIVNKQTDDTNPNNRMWAKDSLMKNSVQAVNQQRHGGFASIEKMHAQLLGSNQRVQKTFNDLKKSR